MTSGPPAARALRQAFDARFAEPPPAEPGERVRLIVVTLGGDPVALRLSELAGISAVSKLVHLPGGAPAFLGIAGARGRVVPVFDLAALAGAGAALRARAWIALATEPALVGLCFDAIDGYLEAGIADLSAAVAGARGGLHVREIVRRGGALVRVVDVPSALSALRAAARGGAP